MLSSIAAGDEVLERYEAKIFRNVKEESLPYRLLRPKQIEPGKRYPLVLFFHGAGERGDDNKLQLVHAMTDFASDDVMEKYPCFVVAPQCPMNERWVDVPWTEDSHTMPEVPTAATRLSLELVDELQNELPIDPTRLYVTGLSMGGFGTWDVVQRYPRKFAAAAPICGGGDTAKAKDIKDVPIWAFHGDSDTTVKCQRSRDMIAALKAAGGNPRYTEYKETGHNSWAPTYRNRELYEWLFSQRLAR